MNQTYVYRKSLRFAEFLETVSTEIEVFCSSEKGSIGVGRNYIEDIFEKKIIA